MERRETTNHFDEPTISVAAVPLRDPRGVPIGLATILLITFLAARTALAEPADLPDVAAAPPPAAANFATDNSDAPLDPEEQSALVTDTPAAVERSLEELLYVRSVGRPLWKPQSTDDLLAVAVANGTNADLEPLNPFRKRGRDLFRTERPLSIGNADMLVRLRLRAKAKRAVSVELRF